MATIMSTIRTYRNTIEVVKRLKAEHDTHAQAMGELLPQINRAEAANNKAREAMLKAIEEGFASESQITLGKDYKTP